MAHSDPSTCNRLSVCSRGSVLRVKMSYFLVAMIFLYQIFFSQMFYLGICPVTKDYECIEGSIAGQPDLLQGTVPGVERCIPCLSLCVIRFTFWNDLCLIFSQ